MKNVIQNNINMVSQYDDIKRQEMIKNVYNKQNKHELVQQKKEKIDTEKLKNIGRYFMQTDRLAMINFKERVQKQIDQNKNSAPTIQERTLCDIKQFENFQRSEFPIN
ncbi:hypothetical protein PPERSA_11291 [Pseudocohnilembus persalinus]|uniref:Uncharacterized protein n=1 Tax=Pseudocohnilembus persalinus TaxID=266149 RepID=A0A0V0QQ04_PSEPJ|nr:hypothetical protein PPERSA_11291 [Pseudocohnilembus persalinus]|eukprot:KRX04167.1 hypothetical protein PPERSA_11291 [Pseudocohnilembus persalinus]